MRYDKHGIPILKGMTRKEERMLKEKEWDNDEQVIPTALMYAFKRAGYDQTRR